MIRVFRDNSLTYGNALTETAAHTLDYEQSQCTVANGATPVSGFGITRGDALNITGITDTVTGGNSQTLAYSAANRLNSAGGAPDRFRSRCERVRGKLYGSKTWIAACPREGGERRRQPHERNQRGRRG